MLNYQAPRRDMHFLLHDVLDVVEHYKHLRNDDEMSRELIDSIIEEGAKFAEQELAPLYQSGDKEGCHFDNGVVTTPKGFKEAYRQYVEGGWPSLAADSRYGGQDLPSSLGVVISDMTGTANWSWAMYPGLSHGALNTLEAHGDEAQKQTYLTKLISGQWTGTMCLTEPQCGSDLGILRTKAEPQADGSYHVTGT